MNSPGHQHRFAVTGIGPVAGEVLGRHGEARVAAVFDHSFYIETAGSMACIVNATLGPGPLNAISSAPPNTNWRRCGLRVGERVILSGDKCRIGGQFVFELDGAKRWKPTPVPKSWSLVSLRAGLCRLDAVARDCVPEDGLGRLAFGSGTGSIDTLVLRRAAGPSEGLRAWLDRTLRCEAAIGNGGLDGVEALLGLGPGLTPSGDDYLGGVMIALHVLGRDRALKHLAGVVSRSMVTRTTAISAAHLSSAMRGMGSAAIHDMLNCLLSGDEAALNPAVSDVDRIGHTSGWDCLAGIAMTLRAWSEVELSKPDRGPSTTQQLRLG